MNHLADFDGRRDCASAARKAHHCVIVPNRERTERLFITTDDITLDGDEFNSVAKINMLDFGCVEWLLQHH
jgi:hypothetical protein